MVAALITALICVFILFGISLWTQSNTNREIKRFTQEQTTQYLNAVYKLYGDWTPVIVRLQPITENKEQDHYLHELGQKIQLWSADNRLLWTPQALLQTSNSADELGATWDKRHILLLNGQVIGYFQLHQDHSVLKWRELLVIFIIGVLVFIVMYGVLIKQELECRLSWKRIVNRLTSLNESKEGEVIPTSSLPISLTEIESTVELELNRLSHRLYRLETVRKSMVADIAHELRTPLSIMRVQLDNVLHSQINLEPDQAILLQDEVMRMSKLLVDLQQLSLAESGHLKLRQAWISLQRLLEEIASVFVVDAEDRGGSLILDCQATFGIYADEDRLRQVFVNLIGNALRYARSAIHISVSLNASTYVVKVSDDGMGIEVEDLPYVFERFYRGNVKRRAQAVDSTATSVAYPNNTNANSGLGLGLPIVKQWIKAHQGSVEVASKWDEGTTFRVQLPVFIE